MSHYTVLWLQQAQDELAQIWIESTDRKAITSATATLDNLLATDPAQQGEELAEGLRRLTVQPLQVWFEVRELDRTVEVSNVKLKPH
jgi:hypothetical protein